MANTVDVLVDVAAPTGTPVGGTIAIGGNGRDVGAGDDVTPVLVHQSVNVCHEVFKGGILKLNIKIRGLEMPGDLKAYYQQAMPEIVPLAPVTAHTPDFRLPKGVVDPRIFNAARAASRAMDEAGIRHALIGGLAVGIYGYVRATKDVSFLVGDEAFVYHGSGIVTHKSRVPIRVNGVAVSVLSDPVVESGLNELIKTRGVPIVVPEVLIYLKLKSHRRRDKKDIIGLLRSGLEEDPIREFLRDLAPELIERFKTLVDQAYEEEQ